MLMILLFLIVVKIKLSGNSLLIGMVVDGIRGRLRLLTGEMLGEKNAITAAALGNSFMIVLTVGIVELIERQNVS